MSFRPFDRVTTTRAGATASGLLTALLLSGCVSPGIQTGGMLSPGSTVQVTVHGEVPFVQVTNRGPGSIEVIWPAAAAGGGGMERLITGSVGRTIRGGGEVLLHAYTNENVRFEIDVQRAGAFDLVISPGSDTP